MGVNRIRIRGDINEYIAYDHETGDMTWKVRVANRVKIGSPAASLNKISGYKQIRLMGHLYQAHRIAYFIYHGEQPNEIDHINGDKSDNRIINLRSSTHDQNMSNRGKNANNTSGYKGVYWHKHHGKYSAKLCVNTKQIHLGYFDSAEEAHLAYCCNEKKYRGAFFNGGV